MKDSLQTSLRESEVRTNGAAAVKWRARAFNWIALLYVMLIYGIPTASCLYLIRTASGVGVVTVLVAPVVWIFVFLACAGLLSLPHRFAVTAGKFLRDLNDPFYFHRRLYGLCWTAVFYNKSAYFACLSIPYLKWMTFRLFGYRGSMSFTVYPDTWIRDLPLLHFEDGVYISNRATLGTNVVMSNGCLSVGDITLGRNALIGHLAMVGPGVELAEDSEVGIGGVVGPGSTIGCRSFISPCSVVANRVRIGQDVVTGAGSFLDSGAVIGDGVHLPPASIVKFRQAVSGTIPVGGE